VAENEHIPFVVTTSAFSVTVLGTKFNVSAYPSDAVRRVVLVQGSVEVNTLSGGQVKLAPDEMFSLSGTEFHSEKADVYDQYPGKTGFFALRANRLRIS
jgi:ferric-dicitrate binding protein FerR (iron transport regulator)